MKSYKNRSFVVFSAAACFLLAISGTTFAQAPAPGGAGKSPAGGQSSSSSGPMYTQEKAPSTLDPAGPTISLISAEPVFLMAASLNACGYDEGLEESAPIRKRVREEINQALAQSEDARNKRDKLCLYIAQHRMTGSELDISQYISLALYLTPPPELESATDLTLMPPDSTQVIEILPRLRDFVAAVDLHGIWLATHRASDGIADQLHDPISEMIVNTNLYLKMPASTYDGRRFIVVVEPMLSPKAINARVYGLDYVVVVSPADGNIRLSDVRHIYLHYIIEPLLFARATAVDRMQPILKEVRDAPLEFRLRSDSLPLSIECLIKAIEARTMDTGIPKYKIPPNLTRSEELRYEKERLAVEQKMEEVRQATVRHDLTQGFVLTQYFYKQLVEFEKDAVSLKDSIGEMVYSMDVDHEVHFARDIEFDKEADGDVLRRSKPRKLEGLDLAEAKLAAGDLVTASAMARQALGSHSDAPDLATASSRAEFILARTALLSGHPDEAAEGFQKTLASSKDARQISWSHIYLGRMLDLDCKRDQAITEYQTALKTRDGQQDTRLAAERGVKAAFNVRGHSCDAGADDSSDVAKPGTEKPAPPNGTNKTN
ncbi:MAG: hypothetical protein WCF54_10040 [Terracidiphilus sp.]